MNNNTQSLWQKIQQSLFAIAPSIGESFQKPAEEAQIKALEDVITQPLPESFKEYLRTFNGQEQSDSPHYFMGYNLLLPTDENRQQRLRQKTLLSPQNEVILKSEISPTRLPRTPKTNERTTPPYPTEISPSQSCR